jgi:hypothetical protein
MRRWAYNTKIDLKEVGWGIALDSVGTVYRRVVGSYEQTNECSGSITDLEFID